MSAALSLVGSPQLSPEEREAEAAAARIEMARRRLYNFVQESWHVTEPGTEPEWNWHIRDFCGQVQAMLEGWLVANKHGTRAMLQRQIEAWAFHGLKFRPGQLLVQNALFNLPPITLKSRILMVCAPAWLWLHCPTATFWAISSVDANVKRDSNAHRQLVESNWYRESFGIKWTIHKRINAVGEWQTTAGGKRTSRTMLAGATGGHRDITLNDDPDDAHKVHSEPIRRETQLKWSRAWKNRINHGDRSIRIAIQQRVHVDDWTAAQVNKGVWSPRDRRAWAWIVMPLLFGHAPKEAPTVSPWGWIDPRRVENENMQPSRFSEEFIADEIREKGPEGFEGQYNQNPQSLDGGMIKRTHVRFFRIIDKPISDRKKPHGCGINDDGDQVETYVLGKKKDSEELDLDWLTVTIDCSNGSQAVTASSVGIIVAGGRGMEVFIFEDRTEIMSIQGMYDAIAQIVRDYRVTKALIELAAAGDSVITELRKLLKTGDLLWPNGKRAIVEVVPIKTGRDSKEGRAAAMAPAWRAGLVFVLEGAEWLYPKIVDGKTLDPGFIGEVCVFPKSKKNDRIDALSQLFTYYRDVIPNRAELASQW